MSAILCESATLTKCLPSMLGKEYAQRKHVCFVYMCISMYQSKDILWDCWSSLLTWAVDSPLIRVTSPLTDSRHRTLNFRPQSLSSRHITKEKYQHHKYSSRSHVEMDSKFSACWIPWAKFFSIPFLSCSNCEIVMLIPSAPSEVK